MEANRGVRARICAAWKALEGDDRQTDKTILSELEINWTRSTSMILLVLFEIFGYMFYFISFVRLLSSLNLW